MHNSAFWNSQFRTDFIPAIHRVRDTFLERLMPTFSSMGSESEQLEQELWDKAMAKPYYGDGPDEADIAEAVRDASVSHYLGLKGMEQGLLNCCALFLYHLYEQHLMLFHRKEILHWKEQDNSKLFTHECVSSKLAKIGIQMSAFQCWQKLEELRLLAGAIKHAEGKSSSQLHQLAPNLFRSPSLSGTALSHAGTSSRVYVPLVGEDLFVTSGDIVEYAACIEQFWSELGSALEGI